MQTQLGATAIIERESEARQKLLREDSSEVSLKDD